MIEKGIQLTDNFYVWLISQSINQEFAHYFRLLIFLVGLGIILVIIDFVAKKLVIRGVKRIFTLNKNKWDDVLIHKKVFNSLAHLVPAYIVSLVTPIVFLDFPFLIPFIHKLVAIYVVITLVIVVVSFFDALEFYFSTSKRFKDKPIESYFQLIKLIFYFIGSIFILSIALGKSPLYLLTAFGAMTAIILLIFKDTILGFVASIQIAANDMLKVDDWVEMDKYGADGDVIKITLNTVKIRNWDNTITTIPTYAFVSDSFKNWRGMKETGARRIKRQIYIRPKSIKFVDDKMIGSFKEVQLIENYVTARQLEIEGYNKKVEANKAQIINGRNMTNIGVFRKYAETYLKKHPMVNQEMTLMVRQMQSNQYGLPLEIYCFANTTEWVTYEGIQSDIMDHLIGATQTFGLVVYELNVTAD